MIRVRTIKKNPCYHRARAQRGFAMPLALLAIAGLTIIAGVSFQIVSAATDRMSALTRQTQTEIAFASAEAEATFVYLTSLSVNGGVLSIRDATSDAAAFEGVATGYPTEALWRADGGRRSSATHGMPVRVTYRDGGAFTPINRLEPEMTEAFLISLGFSDNLAQRFTARLGDFQDSDVSRRFRGAERAEYRLFQMPPPSNSPLRAPEEFAAILDFAEAAPPEFWNFLDEYASVGTGSVLWRTGLAPPELLALLPDPIRPGGDPEDILSDVAESQSPSGRARFLLEMRFETAKGSSAVRRRAVEIVRTANEADRPMRRFWLYDKTTPQVNVVQTSAPDQTDGLGRNGSEYDVGINVLPSDFQTFLSADEADPR